MGVIIVLAIVALVAVPIVLDVVEEARDSANKSAAYNILDAAKLYYTESMFDEDKQANIKNGNNIYNLITMSNEIPDGGQLYVNDKGKTAMSVILDDKCYVKYFESELLIYDKENENCNSYVSEDDSIPTVSYEIIGTLGENGWYRRNDDQTDTTYIKINVADEGSGINYYNWCTGIGCTPNNKEENTNKSISILDTVGTQVCVEAFDNQGNTSGVVCSEEIKKDTVLPEINGVIDLTVEVNAKVDLEKDITVEDFLSGINGTFSYNPTSVDTKKTGVTEVVYTIKDKAGNVKNLTRKVIVSADAPTVTFTAEDSAINAQGWANKDFYVTINVTDNSGHGIKSFNVCTATTDTCDPSKGSTITGKIEESRLISIESNNNRICVQAIDNSDQTSPVICSGSYKLDKTAPTAGTIKVNGSTDIKEWYTTNVTIEAIDGTDELSGHISTTVDTSSITEDTKGKLITVTTTDKAGNTSTKEYTIKVDKTLPVIEFTNPEPNGENGWFKNNTSVTATVTDSNYESLKLCVGLNCEPTNEVTENTKTISISDTTGTQVCVIGTDKAGNESETKCSDVIKVDTVKPEFTGIADITVAKGGTVSLTNGVSVSDVTSDINGTFSYNPTSIDTSKAGVTNVIYTVKDNAGNEKTITRKVIVSADAPTVTFTAEDGAINEQGWAKEDFYVTINVTDNSGHGIKQFNVCTATTDTCEPSKGSTITGKTQESRLISIESNNNRICVQAIDNYNQTSEVICSDAYKLDKTAPTAGTIKVNGSSTIASWYTSNVTIEAVNGSDSLSDHLSTTTNIAGITQNTDGTKVIVTTTDKAGNTATREYTIKVDKNTPTVTIAKSVSNNTNVLTATINPATTASGYTYQWYKDETAISGATSLTYTTTTSGTIKFIATTGTGKTATSNEIKINSYTITYDVNGGKESIASTTKVQDLTTNITSTIPTRDGYEFLGWGSSASDTSVDYATGDPYTANSSTKLFAIWKKTLTAAFNANGAQLSSTTSQSCDIYNAEESCTVNAPTITRSGFTITGFNITTSATTNNSAYSSSTGEITLTASNTGSTWYAITNKTVTLTYNANSGSGSMSNQTCTISNTATTCSITLKVNDFTKSGYTFLGYYGSNYKDAPMNYYADAYSDLKTSFGYDSYLLYSHYLNHGKSEDRKIAPWVAGNTITLSDDGTLYAGWVKTIVIVYNGNGATGGNTSGSGCYLFNSEKSCNINLLGNGYTRTDYTFQGWSTNGSSVTHNANSTYSFSESATVYAIWKPVICRRATTLHKETCGWSDTYHCSGKGYSTGDIVTYGNPNVTQGSLVSGDAFDCDVNGDGTYDATTERFYYVTDLSSNSNYAVLIYYSDTANGVVVDTTEHHKVYSDGTTNYNFEGPTIAKTNLPTTTQWKNVSLYSTTRAIINENGGKTTTGGTLPTAFSYAGYAARLLTAQEVNKACGITVGSDSAGNLITKCTYLLERTQFATYLTINTNSLSYWLETPQSSSSSKVWFVGFQGTVGAYDGGRPPTPVSVRPVIEVPKTDIAY